MTNSVPPNAPIVHAPHLPLTDYYAEESDRRSFLGQIFDRSAADYDRIERLLALGSGPWYRGQALARAQLQAGMRVIDVGVGTGMVARQAARLTGDPTLVVGIDPSPGMLASAKVPDGVILSEGRAEQIPYPDNSFDFLSMGYALRHITDLETAFREFYRVLKPGGRICLLEITKPQGRVGRLLLRGYMRGVVPTLARLIGGKPETVTLWRYYWDTIDACASPAQVIATLEAAGFRESRRHVETRMLSILSEFQAVKPAQI
jgi:demethylmenaquinone methyltransferase/2-methoxy-6-polyprenyl-1,4-benzoquinol methylase